MAQREEIRVFLSSPGDCQPEGDGVLRILDEMNRTIGERERLFFQLVRWEDLPPGLGSNPQAVIDEQLGAYNVLIGVMWMRFRTPIACIKGEAYEHNNDLLQSFTQDSLLPDFLHIHFPRLEPVVEGR